MNENITKTNIINKPMILLREEFASNMVNLINSSKLPLYIIEPIIRDILSGINIEIQKQYEAEKTQYEQAIKNSTNENV